jgi:glutaredoxin-related protein
LLVSKIIVSFDGTFYEHLFSYCKLAKYILTLNHVKSVHTIDLDVLPDGEKIHTVLMDKFCNGIDTVPQIFVNGTWIGGCSSLQQGIADGSFWPTLSKHHSSKHHFDHDLLIIGNGIDAISLALEVGKYGKSVAIVANPWSHFDWGGSLLHTWSIALPMLAEAAKSVSKIAESNNTALKMLLAESQDPVLKREQIISSLLSQTASNIINASNASVWKYRIKVMDALQDENKKGKVVWGKASLDINDDGSVSASIEEFDRKTRISTNNASCLLT